MMPVSVFRDRVAMETMNLQLYLLHNKPYVAVFYVL